MTKPRFHSRVAKQVWMAFIGLEGRDLRTTDLMQWCWPRKTKWHPEEYREKRELWQPGKMVVTLAKTADGSTCSRPEKIEVKEPDDLVRALHDAMGYGDAT
jgi:hypothetical protein